jgi:trehalose 6-phosphate phosphatase
MSSYSHKQLPRTDASEICFGTAAASVALPAPAARLAIFLDIDGTLLEIAATPDGVVVPEQLTATLGRLSAALGGALAILTGRTVAEADVLLAPLRLVTAGVHGTELRLAEGGEVGRLAPRVGPELAAKVRGIARLAPGITVESKGAGLAVHYRNAPSAAASIEAELDRILDHDTTDLALSRGRKVFEILPAKVSKGTALEEIANRSPFAGRVPIMIGDDCSDESALAAAEQLGGAGFKVAGEHFAAGNAQFQGPREVLAFLADLTCELERV